MGLNDTLPDRPLTMDEFRDLQEQDTFDSVMTVDNGGLDNDVLILRREETEHVLHYSDESGWHQCDEQPI